MTIELNKNQAGLTLGTISAIFHTLWAIIVAVGLGGSLSNWIHFMHFMTDIHVIASFSISTAIFGIIEAFIIGYVVGWLFALLWNWFGR